MAHQPYTRQRPQLISQTGFLPQLLSELLNCGRSILCTRWPHACENDGTVDSWPAGVHVANNELADVIEATANGYNLRRIL